MTRLVTLRSTTRLGAMLSLAALTAAGTLGAAAAPAYAAGTGAIEGTILDAASGHVVAGRITVHIACGAVHKSATVDASGHFSIAGLPEGACTLTAGGGGGYVSSTVGVAVTGDAIATVLVNVMTTAYAEQQRNAQASERQKLRRRFEALAGDGFGDGPVPEMAPRHVARAGAMPQPMPAPMAAPKAPMANAGPRPPAPPAAAPVVAARPILLATPVAAAKPVAQAVATTPAVPGAIAGHGAGAAVARGDLARNVVAHRDMKVPAKAVRLDELRAGGKFGHVRDHLEQQAANSWAAVRVFPVPQYASELPGEPVPSGHTRAFDGPRTDFRETVYWNPTVETNASGDADVAFVTSDAVTAFRATAEGFAAGSAGTGQATFQSKLPLTLDAHLPVEVTSGDTIRLPITLTNETDDAIDARLTTQFGAAFKLTQSPLPSGAIHLGPHAKQSLFFPLDVVATDGNASVSLQLTARGLSDQLDKTIRVVPRGFPMEAAASGTVRRQSPAHHTLDLAGALPGSLHASVTMYPSPVAAMTQGMAGMIREPGGCFEQTSSTNYPNIMILGYLRSNEAADPALVQKTQGVLDHGYKLLTGYETPDKGYEWFGKTPGHEALTAYGLMEFADMAKVYDVDPRMVERTAAWLMSRRDHQGGFQRSSQAIDSFGRASPATTNAYIVWALAEARRTGELGQELAAQAALGTTTRDPYLLALAANTGLLTAPRAAPTTQMVSTLLGLQAKDGSFAGAKESITMSGGESLTIEATALATLALIKASPNREYEPQIRAGVDWLNGKRGGYGAWGNTQATVLGLKALTAYTEHARQMASGGSATLVINGKDAGTIKFEQGRRDALVWNDLAGKLAAGKNTIEVRLDSDAALPYTIAVDYRSAKPATSPRTKVALTTQLVASARPARMGDGVTLRAHIENTTQAGIPMTLARIGLPGGTVFQTWQLKELRDKGLIDFYETLPREVILYWRALAPGAKKDIDLDLLAAVPGRYEAPASSAYLYYTAEDKAWTPPVAITIER